jgi:hypothetical protein
MVLHRYIKIGPIKLKGTLNSQADEEDREDEEDPDE